MKKNTFIIRFIDVGLIILFGFVIISDITIRTQIELGGSDTEEEIDLNSGVFIVSIEQDISYTLYNDEMTISYGNYNDLEQLEIALKRMSKELKDSQLNPVAVISPNEEIPIQHMIDVMDLCDKINLSKSIKIN